MYAETNVYARNVIGQLKTRTHWFKMLHWITQKRDAGWCKKTGKKKKNLWNRVKKNAVQFHGKARYQMWSFNPLHVFDWPRYQMTGWKVTKKKCIMQDVKWKSFVFNLCSWWAEWWQVFPTSCCRWGKEDTWYEQVRKEKTHTSPAAENRPLRHVSLLLFVQLHIIICGSRPITVL